jgi:tetratricopeptide (TPR) repeat protein
MATDETSPGSAASPDIGDQNVERLLITAYHPEHADPDFVDRVHARLRAAAGELARAGQEAIGLRTPRGKLSWGRLYAVAAAAAGIVLLLHAMDSGTSKQPSQRPRLLPADHSEVLDQKEGLRPLVPWERPAPPGAHFAAFGETIRTGATERQRRTLADGSVLYVNENTTVRVEAERRVALDRGEVFIEVAPRPAEQNGATFVVSAAQRRITALGTKFAVRVKRDGPGVVVTQGKVQVSGFDGVVSAGEELSADAGRWGLHPAPRASHLLDWIRDLMVGAESPLVPASKHAGGALVALDPFGGEAPLALRKMHIDVYIEDGFARTTIDQTYFNPNGWRMEGTFYFPLPADASLSRLAMYVDGTLREGGMAERDHARKVYETILSTQRDPALLEWLDGSTFKMRVFPLEPRQEKRIILSYTQRLPSLYGTTRYRFPSGHSMDMVEHWSFHARVRGGAGLLWGSSSHPLKERRDGADLVLDTEAQAIKPDRDVTLELYDRGESGSAKGTACFGVGMQKDAKGRPEAKYLMVRYRPQLSSPPRRERRDWVFLIEMSGDRDSLVARAQIEVFRNLLTNAEHHDTFSVLTAGSRVRAFTSAPQPATEENVQKAVRFLEQSHLIGALDLGKGLKEAAGRVKDAANPFLVHIGSGLPVLGERRQHVLAQSIPGQVRYIGVGVGKRWGLSFMRAAAGRTGGHYTQINPDEPIGWRAFDLMATLNTPRLLNIHVADKTGKVAFLNHETALAQGEELCAVARLRADGKDMPKTVTIEGVLDGKPVKETVAVKIAADAPPADYLPRTWARLEIDRLVALDAQKNREQIVTLSKQMYVMSPFTSLLVLENDEMHKQFKVDGGRQDHWAPYDCPKKIKVVTEPVRPEPIVPRHHPRNDDGKKPSKSQVLKTILVRTPAFLGWETQVFGPGGARRRYLSAYELYSGDFAVPVSWSGLPVEENNDVEIYGNSLGFYSPAMALVVRGTSRIYTIRGGGLFTGNRAEAAARHWQALQTAKAIAAMRLNGLDDEWAAENKDADVSDGFGGIAGFAGRMRGGMAIGGLGGLAGIAGLGGLGGIGGIGGFGGFRGKTLDLGDPAEGPPLVLSEDPDGFGGGLGGIRGITGFTAPVTPFPGSVTDDKPIGPMTGWATELALSLETGQGSRTMLYQRPSLGEAEEIFKDLAAYAPGMNTSQADILAVVEAEAEADPDSAPGTIDPAPRALIDKARKIGWQTVTLPARGKAPAVRIQFDGQGRFAYDRTTPIGLRERVICDGKHLWHLYPELGLGARRLVSQFHRAEFSRLVPWALPPAEDLARGADVKQIDQRTVAILPRRKETAAPRIHLVFAADGRLAQRRLIDPVSQRIIYRESYATDGTVTMNPTAEKVAKVVRLNLENAAAPNLVPDMKEFVIVPMPLRAREYLLRSPEAEWRGTYEDMNADVAIALIATESLTQHGPEADRILRARFVDNDDARLGFCTLVAMHAQRIRQEIGIPAFELVAQEYPLNSLAEYLTRPVLTPRIRGAANGFVQRLVEARKLYLHWIADTPAERQANLDETAAHVRDCPIGAVRRLLLDAVLERYRGDDARFCQALAEAYMTFADVPGLWYASRYEHARLLAMAGKTSLARRLFEQLCAQATARGLIPRIDTAFYDALDRDEKAKKEWTDLMNRTTDRLIGGKRRSGVIGLAWQCHELGDPALADHLLNRALAGVPGPERTRVTLVALLYLGHTRQDARAEALLRPLLKDKKLAQDPWLWRLGAVLADRQDHAARAADCMQRALAIEARDPKRVVVVEMVRQDFGMLLNRYLQLAEAHKTLDTKLPKDFAARVVRAADQWRAVEPNNPFPCQAAAAILQKLGERDLAWDYVTTAVSRQPDQVAAWGRLAQTMEQIGQFDLADRAYAEAFAAEPTNPVNLLNRVGVLQQVGKRQEARKLLRRIVDGQWPAEHQGVQKEAWKSLMRE